MIEVLRISCHTRTRSRPRHWSMASSMTMLLQIGHTTIRRRLSIVEYGRVVDTLLRDASRCDCSMGSGLR